MHKDYVFISESVTRGHPDKMCDAISDAIVDHFLMLDPQSHINAECAVATGTLFIAAGFGTRTNVDIPGVARQVIDEIGYRSGDFTAKDCTIMTSFSESPRGDSQSPEQLFQGEQDLDDIKPRDQVTAFGFACNHTATLMPLPIELAHRLARGLDQARADLDYLLPDAKTQVGVGFRDGRPVGIQSVSLSVSRSGSDGPGDSRVRDDLMDRVVKPVFAGQSIAPDSQTQFFVNVGTTGGPAVHAGLTGRKTAIDTYGEYARHSGAALSGKDIHRIDRIAAYGARYAAKHIVAAGMAERCEVALSYTIGVPRPISILVETFGTGERDEGAIKDHIERVFDFRLGALIRDFGMRSVVVDAGGRFFQQLAAYGHMGREELDLPWERLDRLEEIGQG